MELACSQCPLGRNAFFVFAFQRFSPASPSKSRPRHSIPRWITVATAHPLGDCDLPGLETFPDYLTELGAVSNRP